jgi:N-acetylglucosamine-6-phosphate deacetylase
MMMLSGADVVFPDGRVRTASVFVEDGLIADVRDGEAPPGGPRDAFVDLHGLLLVPGFIDVHVHGVGGRDVQDPGDPLRAIAAALPRYGVTSFCPTTIACDPPTLGGVLASVRALRAAPAPGSARVLPAHLESNFINPDYRGAQPLEMLRAPCASCGCLGGRPARRRGNGEAPFTGDDIFEEICRAEGAVAIATVAPELEGALPQVSALVAAGVKVSLGHSGASFDVGLQAAALGASQATHLFNRMPPLNHREPGLAGAVLSDPRVAVEVICDGKHVHPAMVRFAIEAKGLDRVMAITDGTAGAGLPDGSRHVIGGYPITVRDSAAYLDDGTLAGSALTFDGAFRVLVSMVGLSLGEASRLCSANPAREMGLADRGTVAPGLLADLVALDRSLHVARAWVGGREAFGRG